MKSILLTIPFYIKLIDINNPVFLDIKLYSRYQELLSNFPIYLSNVSKELIEDYTKQAKDFIEEYIESNNKEFSLIEFYLYFSTSSNKYITKNQVIKRSVILIKYTNQVKLCPNDSNILNIELVRKILNNYSDINYLLSNINCENLIDPFTWLTIYWTKIITNKFEFSPI